VAVGGVAVTLAALGMSACAKTLPPSAGPSATSASSSSVSDLANAHAVSSSRRDSPPTTARAPRPLSPSSPAPLVTSTKVVQGWISAFEAYIEAAYSDDWSSPSLPETTVEPELGKVEAELRWMAAAHDVITGTAQIESVQVSALSGSSAAVVSCVDGLVMNGPQDGASGAEVVQSSLPDLYHAQMLQTSGGWKLESESEEVEQCPSE
jgi:hypothetical protein